MTLPLRLGALLPLPCCLLLLLSPPAAADLAGEAAAVDEGQRVQALQALGNASPRLLGQLLHYVLAPLPVEAHASLTADISVQSPVLAVRLRADLAGTLQKNTSLAQLALQWLKLQGPAGFVAPLLVSELTPERLDQLAQADPACFGRFVAWLSGEAPEAVGEVAQRALRGSGAGAANLVLALVRKYPQLVPRAVGFLGKHCPALLPRLMRLVLQKGPVPQQP